MRHISHMHRCTLKLYIIFFCCGFQFTFSFRVVHSSAERDRAYCLGSSRSSSSEEEESLIEKEDDATCRVVCIDDDVFSAINTASERARTLTLATHCGCTHFSTFLQHLCWIQFYYDCIRCLTSGLDVTIFLEQPPPNLFDIIGCG